MIIKHSGLGQNFHFYFSEALVLSIFIHVHCFMRVNHIANIKLFYHVHLSTTSEQYRKYKKDKKDTGADLGFLERGLNPVRMYKCWGVRFADFISFFLNIPWK